MGHTINNETVGTALSKVARNTVASITTIHTEAIKSNTTDGKGLRNALNGGERGGLSKLPARCHVSIWWHKEKSPRPTSPNISGQPRGVRNTGNTLQDKLMDIHSLAPKVVPGPSPSQPFPTGPSLANQSSTPLFCKTFSLPPVCGSGFGAALKGEISDLNVMPKFTTIQHPLPNHDCALYVDYSSARKNYGAQMHDPDPYGDIDFCDGDSDVKIFSTVTTTVIAPVV
jgi:hypothetical protein